MRNTELETSEEKMISKEKLQPGNIMMFEKSTGTLMFFQNRNDISRILWPNGDNKRPASFIHNVEDFLMFARIIADTHGFAFEKTPGNFPEETVTFKLL